MEQLGCLIIKPLWAMTYRAPASVALNILYAVFLRHKSAFLVHWCVWYFPTMNECAYVEVGEEAEAVFMLTRQCGAVLYSFQFNITFGLKLAQTFHNSLVQGCCAKALQCFLQNLWR